MKYAEPYQDLEAPPGVIGVYRHYKGNYYQVTDPPAYDPERKIWMVVYQPVVRGPYKPAPARLPLFVRDYEDFIAMVGEDQLQPRFRRVVGS